MLHVPSRPLSGLVFTPNVMRTVGSSTRIGGSAFGFVRIGNGLADEDFRQAGDGHDFARVGLFDFDALQA